MAVVKYIDSEGHKRFADEDSKAYQKHLKSTKSEDAGRVNPDAPKVESPKPALKIEPKSDAKG
ncbi:hypothetical protein LQL77_07075 [Rhodococcus cerastii]|nr:hypothetical protein [Rhodococcus cerastii]